MDVMATALTAVVTLVAVVLGGWLSLRGQDRSWRRDHARQWRDIRLEAYKDFIIAFRQYIAYVLEPAAKISAVPHPRRPDYLMPFFDQGGRPYKERLESAKTKVRLVAQSQSVLQELQDVIQYARAVAAERASRGVNELSSGNFELLWEAEDRFISAARRELGLSVPSADRAARDTMAGELRRGNSTGAAHREAL